MLNEVGKHVFNANSFVSTYVYGTYNSLYIWIGTFVASWIFIVTHIGLGLWWRRKKVEPICGSLTESCMYVCMYVCMVCMYVCMVCMYVFVYVIMVSYAT